MKHMKISVVLLALLLVAMAMVPLVSAASTTDLCFQNVDVSKIQTPNLQFNTTQTKVIVSGELSPSAASAIPASTVTAQSAAAAPYIPYGAIIYHSRTGVTTVFDSTGKQLFATDDVKAATLSNGAPATYVHEIPSGSTESEYQGKTYVTYGSKLILTIINENDAKTVTASASTIASTTSSPQVAGVMLTSFYKGWIEYAQSSVVTADRVDSTWVAPTKTPAVNGLKQSLGIWNGIQQSGVSGVLQPVLMWNFAPVGDPNIYLKYTGAAWDYRSGINQDSLHSTPIDVSPGQTVEGTLQWSPTLNCWLIQFKNVATGRTTDFKSSRLSRNNLNIFMTLEAAGSVQGTTSALTGPISFQNNIIQYQGVNVPITFTGYIWPGASSVFSGLNPRVSTYPSLQVNLDTGR